VCGRTYLFKALGFVNEDEGVRLYGLSELPGDALGSVVAALRPYMEPRWPIWAPIWKFPEDSNRIAVDSLIDRVLSSAGPMSEVIMASELDREILQARVVSDQEASHVEDWSCWMGMAPTSSPLP